MLSHIRRRWRRARNHRERGAITLELVLAAPLMLGCMLVVVQAGLWMHATHVAQTTAARSLESARAYNATSQDGQHTAQLILAALGGGTLKDPHAEVTRTATTARVHISGHAVQVIPWMHLPVNATAAGAVERFVPADGGTP